MTLTLTGAILLAIGALVVMLVIRIPVAFSLALAGGLGLYMVEGWDFTFAVLAREPFSAVARFSLVIIPLFILMGILAKSAGLGQDIFWVLSRRFQRVPGGLALATIVACAGFAAVSGSSVAAVATLGPITITEMRRYGYSDRIASGVVAAAGTLGILIPPSIVLVLYGVLSGLSIERLLIAGIVPGVVSAILYALVSFKVAKRSVGEGADAANQPVATARPSGAVSESALWSVGESPDEGTSSPAGSSYEDSASATSESERHSTRAVFEIVLIFLVVIGGLYLGIFTATESAAVGAILALVILVLRQARTPGGLMTAFTRSLGETISVTAMVFALLIGASIFSTFLVIAGVTRDFGSIILGIDAHRLVIMAGILLFLIALGMFLDGISILLIMVPLLHPLVTLDLGLDGLWFAILMVKVIEIGLITPPVGINAYVVAGSVPGLKPETVYRGVLPYYVADMIMIGVLFAVPGLVTWLPNIMVGG